MIGFTITCNNCGNAIKTSDNFEAVNGKINFELWENYIPEDDEIEYSSFLFCWECCNSTHFK